MMTSTKLHNCESFIKSIYNVSPRNRKSMLNLVPDESVHMICETLHNMIHPDSKIKLSPKQTKTLKKFRSPIRKLTAKDGSAKTKRKIIQTGGFIGSIFPIIASVLGSLLGNIINSKQA